MQSWFTFELDGDTFRVERESARLTLAGFLARTDPVFASFRDHRAHRGGRLVVMGDIEGDRHRFRVVDAGLMLLPMLAGRQVWTAAGIREAEPEHPVNLALRKGSFECGPERLDTLAVLMFEGYYRPDLRRRGQTADQFDAVATRSANAPAIREAAAEVFASTEQLRHEADRKARRSGEESTVWTGRRDIFGDRFTRALFRLKERPPIDYVDGDKQRFLRPGNLVELLKLLREYPDAELVAGGTSLLEHPVPGRDPSKRISLEGVKELNILSAAEEEWEIGGAVPLTRIAESIGRECTPFNKILRRFGTRAVRNRATLGGHLAVAWPLSQLAPLLLALNARVLLLSEEGERDAPLSRYFDDSGGTVLAPGEIVRSIVVPRAGESALAARGLSSRLCDVYCAAPRRTLCAPYATGAFAVELRDRQVAKAWIAYTGVGPGPLRVREAEEFLAGKTWSEKTVFDTLPVLRSAVERLSERSASRDAAHARQLAVTLLQKFYYQHPRPESARPEALTAAGEFGRLDEPFHDAFSAGASA